MMPMANAVTGAATYSSVVQAINKVVIESKLLNKKNDEILKNMMGKLDEITLNNELSQEIEAKTSDIKKDINRIKNNLKDAIEDEDEKAKQKFEEKLAKEQEKLDNTLKEELGKKSNTELSEEEKEILGALNTKKELEASKDKKMNTILTNKMREIYEKEELCPYCHNKNENCGFKAHVKENAPKTDTKGNPLSEEERMKSVYAEEKRGKHKGQDKEGKELISNVKEKLKGEKMELNVDEKRVQFDIGENMAYEDHHLASISAYNDTTGVAVAGKTSGYDINLNYPKEEKPSNIVSCVSVSSGELVGYDENGKKIKDLYFESAKKKKIEGAVLLNEEHKQQVFSRVAEELEKEMKSENSEESLGHTKYPHKGPHKVRGVDRNEDINNKLESMGLNEKLKEEKLTYEEAVTIEMGAIQEKIYKDMAAGKYRCGNMEQANKQFNEEMSVAINNSKANLAYLSKYGEQIEKTSQDRK